jgi:hypothetical protein
LQIWQTRSAKVFRKLIGALHFEMAAHLLMGNPVNGSFFSEQTLIAKTN